MTKEDILSYLNNLRKPEDQGNGWINSYNNRQMIFLKFFKWLHNQDEPEVTKRVTPTCMSGVKRITRREKTSYRPSDIWDERDVSVFLNIVPIREIDVIMSWPLICQLDGTRHFLYDQNQKNFVLPIARKTI